MRMNQRMMTEIPDTSPDRRQEERRPVELRAFARPAGGDVAQARISDLSYDGCGMACTPAPHRRLSSEYVTGAKRPPG